MARLFGPRDLLIVVDANTLSARQELRSKLAEVRELPAPLCSIPIIALTTNAMKGDQEKYLDAGMNDYVSKPVDPIALSDAIERQSGITTTIGARKRRRLPTAPAPTTTESDIETLFAGIDDIVK